MVSKNPIITEILRSGKTPKPKLGLVNQYRSILNNLNTNFTMLPTITIGPLIIKAHPVIPVIGNINIQIQAAMVYHFKLFIIISLKVMKLSILLYPVFSFSILSLLVV